MAYFEKISSVTPIPFGLPQAQRLPHRKPREDRSESPTNRRPQDKDQDAGDKERIHIDEYI